MELIQGWSEEGFCFELSGSSQFSLRHECLCRSLTNAHTSSLSLAHAHMINVATLPSLTFTAMQSKENFQLAFHTRLSLSFSHSFIQPFFLPQSYSLGLSFFLILLLTTLFSAGLAGCRSAAAPEWGTFCWNSFWWN